MPSVTTRFAPSPTGYLHVGGARTALFNWLLSHHEKSGSQFLLRIEDTDLARSTQQACDQLLEDLKWLGLHWDNAANLVFQSKRVDVYNKIIVDLMARDLAYEAYETPDELNALRKDADKNKRAFIYRNPNYTPDQLRGFKDQNRPAVIRFAMPVKEYHFHDAIAQKEIVLPPEEAQDFVIRKADGMPTYHFAVVIDDQAMNVTHILRGQEHTKNTFNHIALMEALNYQRPIFAHLSTIQNPDGSKMGKRDRDKKVREATYNFLKNTKKSIDEIAAASGLAHSRLSDWLDNSKSQLDPGEHEKLMPVIHLRSSDLPEILIHDFRKNGYLPEALLNFLALLGWSPGENRELMTMDEMIQLFSIERISNANAKFDRAKLLSFNTQTIERTSAARLLSAFRDYLAANPDSPLNDADDASLSKVLAMKKGMRTLREADEASRFLFIPDDAITYDPVAVEKVLNKQDGRAMLQNILPSLQSATTWTAHDLEQLINTHCQPNNIPLNKFAQPLRVAISGTTISPPIFQSLEFLGKQHTLARIHRCLQIASP